MKCESLRSRLAPGFLDPDSAVDRKSLIDHLRVCRSCRAAALAVEPTILFSLASSPEVRAEEVEEIRQTVQAVRRMRLLEASWERSPRRGLLATGLAALLLVALFLVPGPADDRAAVEVPFADALGVGTGLVSMTPTAADTDAVELRLELDAVAAIATSDDPGRSRRIDETMVSAAAGSTVDRRMGDRYRVHFRLQLDDSAGTLELENLELTEVGSGHARVLVGADVRLRAGRAIVVGVPSEAADGEQLWLRVVWTGEMSPSMVEGRS